MNEEVKILRLILILLVGAALVFGIVKFSESETDNQQQKLDDIERSAGY